MMMYFFGRWTQVAAYAWVGGYFVLSCWCTTRSKCTMPYHRALPVHNVVPQSAPSAQCRTLERSQCTMSYLRALPITVHNVVP